jgi:hypothetical protein
MLMGVREKQKYFDTFLVADTRKLTRVRGREGDSETGQEFTILTRSLYNNHWDSEGRPE